MADLKRLAVVALLGVSVGGCGDTETGEGETGEYELQRCDDPTEVVEFADPALEQAVREAAVYEAIELPEGYILQGDLCGLTEIGWYLGPSHLGGLECFAPCGSLRKLGSCNTGVGDLTPMSGLTSLEELILWDNGLSDVSPLSGLTSLTLLYLDSNSISDVSALSGLNNLTELNLYGNNITDLSPLSGLNNLMRLTLSQNRISDLGPLVDNPGLAEGDQLYVWGNPLDEEACCTEIPTLVGRGAELFHITDDLKADSCAPYPGCPE